MDYVENVLMFCTKRESSGGLLLRRDRIGCGVIVSLVTVEY